MIGQAVRVAQLARTVADLDRAEAFYRTWLGFRLVSRQSVEPELCAALGAESGEQSLLARGGQRVALQRLFPPGRAYPEDDGASALFQHLALPDDDIDATVARLPDGGAITRGGPQRLPASSGGVTAYKFRDPDGHPLELIAFPDHHAAGIDHSAIVVADADRSIAFYRDRLGFSLVSRGHNIGPEQDRLDGLPGASVEVVALAPLHAPPHLELLAYAAPPVRPAPPYDPRDVVSTRLVLAIKGHAGSPTLIRDPDGHQIVLCAATFGT